MSLTQLQWVQRMNDTTEEIINLGADRLGLLNGDMTQFRRGIMQIMHQTLLDPDHFAGIVGPPQTPFGWGDETQLADLRDAGELSSVIRPGKLLDLGSGTGAVVWWFQRHVVTVNPLGVEANINNVLDPRIPHSMHHRFDFANYLSPEYTFGLGIKTLYYFFNGSSDQVALAAKIAEWSGRLIVYTRGAEQSNVLAWISACGGTVVQMWLDQHLVVVDV